MPTCKRCKVVGPIKSWPRYERNGRPTVLCAACNEREEQHRGAVADAHARGYASAANTPEYKRGQREEIAARERRILDPYVPTLQRHKQAGMKQAEHAADQLRAKWAIEWLKPFRSEGDLYRMDTGFREMEKAKSRSRYGRNRSGGVSRVLNYKRNHRDHVVEWSDTRRRRLMVAADGTATPDQIARLKAGATHCAYCLARLSEKFTDHMIAVALSGPHSLRNIVIVCPTCSGRKADLSYEVWVERLAVEHRMRATTLFAERFGDVRNVA